MPSITPRPQRATSRRRRGTTAIEALREPGTVPPMVIRRTPIQEAPAGTPPPTAPHITAESAVSLAHIFDDPSAGLTLPRAAINTAAEAYDDTRREPDADYARIRPWDSPYMRYDSPARIEHRGYRFTVSQQAIAEAGRDETPNHRGKNIEVSLRGDNFENRLADAIIPMMAKKIRELSPGQPLPMLIKASITEDCDASVVITL